MIALVTTSQTGPDMQEKVFLEKWKDGLLNLDLIGKITGVLHVLNDSVADVVQSDRTDILYGQDYFLKNCLAFGLRCLFFFLPD